MAAEPWHDPTQPQDLGRGGWHRRSRAGDQLRAGTKPGFADLKRGGERVMATGDIARCYPEHIHSVRNVGRDISMSLHTYGRHINYTGRSEFDLEQKREKPFMIKVAADALARA